MKKKNIPEEIKYLKSENERLFREKQNQAETIRSFQKLSIKYCGDAKYHSEDLEIFISKLKRKNRKLKQAFDLINKHFSSGALSDQMGEDHSELEKLLK